MEELKKKYNTVRNEHITQAGELERLRTEFFVASQKLASMEKEHSEEMRSYQDEIEDLNAKVTNLQQKLDEIKNEEHNTSQDSNGLELEDTLSPDLGLKLENDHLSHASGGVASQRRNTTRISFSTREKRISMAMGMSSQNDLKAKMVHDAVQKDLQDKLAELQQQVNDSHLTQQKLKIEVDHLTAKLKESNRNLELAEKKLLSREEELEHFRNKILSDTDKFTMALNELHDEIEIRENQIKTLKKRIRSLQTQTAEQMSPLK